MVILTDLSPLSGEALLGQEALTGSVLDNATALGSSTNLTKTLSMIPSMDSESAYISKGASINSASGTIFSSSSGETKTTNEDNLNSDPLTGMVEGAPPLNTAATIQSSATDSQALVSAGVRIKDTNYSIPNNAYFVSPTGNNSNSGTKSSPWRTIGKAIDSASRGSTIVLRGGTYREGGLTLKNKLTFQPYPHEEVWIKGSTAVTDWDADGSTWRKDNWNYQFPPNTQPQNIDPAHPMSAHRDMVFVNGNSLEQVSSKDKVDSGEFYVDYANNKLYIGNNPSGKTVEATTSAQFFTGWDAATGSVIRGLGFAHYAETGLFVTQPMTFENNTFTWNGIRGLAIYGTNSTVIRGNTFNYNGRNGLRVHGAARTLVENNYFSYNNVARFANNFDAAGAKFTESDNLILRDNVAQRNQAHGLWVDQSSINATIVSNVARYNRDGIFFEKSHKAIIADNLVFQNDRIGINVFESSDAKVYNNTVSKNPVNIEIGEGGRQNTNATEIAAGATWNTEDNVVKNNILSNAEGTKDGEGDLHLTALLNVDNKERPQSTHMVTGLDHNAYYRTTSSRPMFAIKYKPQPNMSGTEVNFEKVANFRTKYSKFEANALAIDNAKTSPFFVNEEGGNYQLKSGSSAIKAGTPLPADVASAIGVQDGVRVNLGSIKFG